MRALYNCAFADPWVKVAEGLEARYGIEPAYWIGYADDDSERLVGTTFPKAMYHPYFDAWKGVFPEKIEEESWAHVPDPQEYESIAQGELLALHLMDRMDFDQRSFSHQERRMLFRKFIRCWSYVIERFRIEALISPTVPHRSFDYPLYLVCQRRGVKLVSFASTTFSQAARIIAVSNPHQFPDEIRREFDLRRDLPSPDALPDDIRDSLARMARGYEAAKPETFKELYRYHKNNPSLLLTGRKFLTEMTRKRNPWIGKYGWLMRGVPSYHKTDRDFVERSRSRQGLLRYSAKIYRRLSFLKRLKAEHDRNVTGIDPAKPFVILALHYQPEATTSPRAGIFSDQLYVMELLSRHLPRDWQILVKENPMQFNPIAEGNTGRPLRFYRDAAKIPRVSFIPLNADPFSLIDAALAVFTVSGTIGWEGMARGKPVICFGPAWYEYYAPGVLRVQEAEDLGKAADFIRSYRLDEAALRRYLAAIGELSLRAYFRRGLKQKAGISEEDCVKSLERSVAKQLQAS